LANLKSYNSNRNSCNFWCFKAL